MDTILPSQFFSRLRAAAAEPEKRLMVAVLEEAVRTYQRLPLGRSRHAHKLVREVEEWFTSADVLHPFAFLRICDALGLDASWLREGLARWRARQEALGEAAARLARTEAPRLAS